MKIVGTTAMVTGGASGLGLATANRLVAAGGNDVIIDLERSAGATVTAKLGPAAAFSAGDVTDAEAVIAALDRAVGLTSPLRTLINCAGIGTPAKVVGRNGPLPLDRFRNIIEVNLIGTFNVIRLAAERILAQSWTARSVA